jgi:type I restriction enzyme M protein
MFKIVSTEVFPFLRQYGDQVGGDDSTYSDQSQTVPS